MNEPLALVAVILSAASGLLALFAASRPRDAERIFLGVLLAGAACGLVAGGAVLAGYGGVLWALPWRVPGGALAIQLDALSAMFLVSICLIGPLGAIFGAGYFPAHEQPQSAAKLRVFYGMIVAGMALLVIARNSILFLMGWELMALAAYLAIITDDRDPLVREVGFVYLVATRIGTLAIIVCFSVLRQLVGSFSLSASGLDGGSTGASAVFVLGLCGFGLKAGLMPLHVWLPGAHANAPSHVSALLSGVLIKMGIYGLCRVTASFEAIPIWWGGVLFGLGLVSALLGVVFAIGQHDLKRLLAYHSVENIGIIALGLGVALFGRATQQPTLIALGFAGAMLHVWNHGLFKALLFLSAGSLIRAAKTRDLDQLGGLLRKLPKTGFAFLLGAVAICGLPPLNGFVSELLVYLSLLHAGLLELGEIGIAAALAVPALGMVGALAALCFAKVFGVVFLGQPRGARGRDAQESPPSMLWPMAVLGGGCVVIGAAPRLVTPLLERATAAWLGTAPRAVLHEPVLHELAPLDAISWFNPLLAVLLLATALLMLERARSPATRGPTWDCAYLAPNPRMQYTASSFAAGLVNMFAFVLRPRVHSPGLRELFPRPSKFASHVPEVVLDLVVLPLVRAIAWLASGLRWIQHGKVQVYFLYVLGALVLMLSVWR